MYHAKPVSVPTAARRLRTLVAALVALFAAGPLSHAPQSAEAASPLIGRQPPEIELSSGMYGITPNTKLSDYAGEVRMVLFWAVVCPKCKPMIDLVQRLHQNYGSRGLKTIAICGSNHWATLRLMRERGYNFGVGVDPYVVNARRWGVRQYPRVFIIGRDGICKPIGNKLLYQVIEEELAKPRPGQRSEVPSSSGEDVGEK